MTKLSPILESARFSGLISAEQLMEVLTTNPGSVKMVDATYPSNASLPGIANAVTFDIDDIADPDSYMPHMLPSARIFAEKIGALGISNDDFVITYDQTSVVMAASRAWWMFRTFGHNNVAVLDGGMMGWVRRNYPVQPKEHEKPARFNAVFNPNLVISYDQMKTISLERSATIIDARPPERFVDHIPGSKNIPALSLVSADRQMKSSDLFKEDLKNQDITVDSKIVTTCGSGVTACALALALFREGKKDVAVYDGSWTEWSSHQEP